MKRWKVLHGLQFTVHGSQQKIIDVLLKNRGISAKQEIEEFLEPRLESVSLRAVGIDKIEVEKTLERIKLAIKNNEAIVIYGDYDVDGICATAILWETIYAFYKQSLPPSEIKNVHPYIPHRVDEGYGLSEKGIENLKLKIKNCGLIITVDNGIVATKAVEYANKRGIDVIITDHHVKGKTLPKARSIIHTTELCGAGIAYLLSREMYKIQNPRPKTRNDHLELVALATVADLVPLNKYNRTLLKLGLEALQKTKRPGLLALFDEAKIKKEEIDTYRIGHMIAPRLNASGRITYALDSLRLICTTSEKRAKTLARELDEINRERQRLTFESALDAVSKIKNQKSKIENLVFVQSETYEQGVIGLIASRLVEEFYRPAIAVSVGEKISKGSARSIPGVNIIELIRSVPDFLTEAGGHPMAAGFSIKTETLQDFKNALINQAKKTIDKKLFDRIFTIDLELGFEQITMELFEALQQLKPFGMGNPVPVFMTKGVAIASVNSVGKDGNHLQILLKKDGAFFKGIKFNHGTSDDLKISQLVDIAYTLEMNEWKGNKKLELRIKDLK